MPLGSLSRLAWNALVCVTCWLLFRSALYLTSLWPEESVVFL